MNKEKLLGYLGGDIMGFGSNLARQYEYDKFIEADIPAEIYSPVMNKSINDKKSVTKEENDHLAEKITEADIDRLWNSDFTVMEPRQDAIGTLCEVGCLYGWWYFTQRIAILIRDKWAECHNKNMEEPEINAEICDAILDEIFRIGGKQNFFHYFDIRTNGLDEKDWRRSFSINQLLYGMVLACSADGKMNEKFDDILPKIKQICTEAKGDSVDEESDI
jgi:hypothetical protein